jgi:hypothetical protein
MATATATPDYAAKKTKRTISRSEFRERAKPAKVTLEYEGKAYVFEAVVKEYDTGSLGWGVSDKAVLTLDGRDVKCQVGMNVTAIGSKELPK